MTKTIANFSIKHKLLLIVVVPNILSLLVVSSLLLFLEIGEFKKNTQDDLSAIASIIANRSTAALLYDDEELATENLAVINSLPEVKSACIYDANNKIFSKLIKDQSDKWDCPVDIKYCTTKFANTRLSIVQPILIDKEQNGMVYILADFSDSYWRKIQFVGLLCLVLFIVSLASFLLTAPLLKLISSPISKLVDAVKAITASHDYSLRTEKVNDDELGVLVDSFNSLIDTVEEQNLALSRAKDRYLMLYDSNPSMIFNVNSSGDILSINQTSAERLDLNPFQLASRSIFEFIDISDIATIKSFIKKCVDQPAQIQKQEFRQVKLNTHETWLKITGRSIKYDNSLLLVCEDITESKELSRKLAHQASHDALTGLANRIEFDRYVQQALDLVYENNSEHILCYLDLDQFKIINDTCGHLAGDELLRQLGNLLKKQIREQDSIARLGGDEFGVLMYYCSLNKAFSLCERLRDVIQNFRFSWEEKIFTIGVSMGLASINKNSRSAVHLFKEADSACYAAKDKGRNRIHVYNPDDEELVLRQGEMQWVEKIQRGLENDNFCLYGQYIVPIVDEGAESLHFEVLIRYCDEQNDLISPSMFLPAAERYGLSPAVDRWVISHVFEFIATTPNFLDKLSVCSINLSGLSFSDESMLGFIFEQFNRWQIPTHKICFEVTETVAIANLSSAIKFIESLKRQGCLFSLDDFGSGFSSFGYLKHLPVDYLKIDGLFVKDILDDKVDLAMVKAINEVGHIMGKKTIAEFVENERIFGLLNGLGVDYAQGYIMGKPIPLSEIKLMQPFTTSSI
ncbi:Cyclic di-GMP phosphodiesterase PdeB [Patescibacteria group bacterium]|nr:Cyclic di-GMP phosphodiesterase PdeB [Patescibacteria group bacterium]